jgi:hypothetical protein
VAGALVVAEPRDHQADALDLRPHRLQPVERNDDIGRQAGGVQVLGHRRAAAVALADRLRRVGELDRGRDHRHRARQPLGGVGIGERTEHLEGDLRQPIAEAVERQLLEDHIGRAPVGGRRIRTHLRRDERGPSVCRQPRRDRCR